MTAKEKNGDQGMDKPVLTLLISEIQVSRDFWEQSMGLMAFKLCGPKGCPPWLCFWAYWHLWLHHILGNVSCFNYIPQEKVLLVPFIITSYPRFPLVLSRFCIVRSGEQSFLFLHTYGVYESPAFPQSEIYAAQNPLTQEAFCAPLVYAVALVLS